MHLQKKFAFDKVRTKWIEVELKGNKAADIFDKTTKREFLYRWIETLKLKKHLDKLTLKAFEFHRQSEKL